MLMIEIEFSRIKYIQIFDSIFFFTSANMQHKLEIIHPLTGIVYVCLKCLKLSSSGPWSADAGPQPAACSVPPGPGAEPLPGSARPLPGDPHLARGGVAPQARHQGLAQCQEDQRLLPTDAGEVFLC